MEGHLERRDFLQQTQTGTNLYIIIPQIKKK